jgi:hypothetical protein
MHPVLRKGTRLSSGWTWVANRQEGVSPSDHSRHEQGDHWCLGSPDLLLSAHTAVPACGTTLPSVPAMDRQPNRSKKQGASIARSWDLPALVWPSASPKRLGHRGPSAVKRFAMSLLRLVGCIGHPNHRAQATGRTYANTLMSGGVVHAPHLHRARSKDSPAGAAVLRRHRMVHPPGKHELQEAGENCLTPGWSTSVTPMMVR